MGFKKSPSSGWSYLRDNQKLKGVISYQIQALNYSLVDLATASGTRADQLSKYLRGERPSITNFQLVKICDILKIDLDLVIKILP